MQYSLDSQIQRWPDFIPSVFVDIETELKVHDQLYLGRGVDLDINIAKDKALSEAIERYCCQIHNINSNGVAAHTNQDFAYQNAKLELLERDAFFCHYFGKIPLIPLKLDTPCLEMEVSRILQKYTNIKFYALHGVAPYHYRLCIFEGVSSDRDFSYIIGLGSHEDATKALRKAFLEALRSFAGLMNFYKESLIQEQKVSTPLFHKYQAFHPDNRNIYESYIESFKFMTVNFGHENEFDFKVTKFDQHIAKRHSVVRVQCNQLQSSFFQRNGNHDFNLERLQNVTNQDITLEELLSAPIHPMG